MSADYEHLNLQDWPFQMVPSAETAGVWVGRPEFLKRLRSVLRTARRVDASRIVLLWAAFGAGKTHALRHLESLTREDANVRALYVVTPKGIRSFLDIYRAIVDSALSTEILEELGLTLYKRFGPSGGSSELQRALIRLVALDEAQTRPIVSWLKAEKVAMRELRDSGLRTRIENSVEAVETLDELIGLVRDELGAKVLLMLDEIQELGELAARYLDEAVGGLHKVFDRNTEGLTFVLSFTTASQSTVARIIGETLFERRSETLTLSSLSPEDGAAFISDLIESRSVDPQRAPFPFQDDALPGVIDYVGQIHPELTPRELIRAFDMVLREADMDIEDGGLESVSREYALEKLHMVETEQSDD